MNAIDKPAAADPKASKTPVLDRYDIVVLLDGVMTNPNGDPDNGNRPRQDPLDGTGFMTPVSLKRKIRDYLATVREVPLYHANGVVLREQRQHALTKAGIKPSGEEALADEDEEEDAEEVRKPAKGRAKGKGNNTREAVTREDLLRNQRAICDAFWDARTFGAVMDTGAARAANARGPVAFSSAMSIDPVHVLENTITRQSVEKREEGRNDKDREMGSVSVIRYGLYRFEVSVHPHFAQITGFGQDDFELLKEALINAFEFDQSSNRRLSLRGIYVFCHQHTDGRPSLGRAPRAKLLERIQVRKKEGVEEPRAFHDYDVTVDKDGLPEGITFEQWA